MKILKIIILSLLFTNTIIAQTAGNTVYALNGFQLPNSEIQVNTNYQFNSDMKVKGLANVVADSYTAIFSLRQSGDNVEMTDHMMNTRINSVINELNRNLKVETYVDMISFVPLYTFDEVKKIFSKTTYNEIPAGFELIKNIHVKYTHYADLDKIIKLMAEEEIYDLVRVDYYSKDLDQIKDSLKNEAIKRMKAKRNDFQSILQSDFENKKLYLNDAFKIVLPVEQYQRYQAYSTNSTMIRKQNSVRMDVQKVTTLYYQPVMDKEFDFVFNPEILEPVIQIIYEIDLITQDLPLNQKQYFVVNENGQLTELSLVEN